MPKSRNKNKGKHVMPTIRIFCEGEKTEPIYLKAFIDSLPPTSSRFGKPIVEQTVKNTPVQLVIEAIKHKQMMESNDIYWVVYDRESEHKYSDRLHSIARQNAHNNDINIAFCNVCFEYWLLLHFEYTSAPYNSYADLLNRSNFRQHLRNIHIGKYEKGNAIVRIFESLKSDISTAEQNAEKLRKDIRSCAENGRNEPYQLNPYVDIDILLQNIRNFIDPFGYKTKNMFNSEFNQYYNLKLSNGELAEYIKGAAPASAKRLSQIIEPSILSIILDTLINERTHELNENLLSNCFGEWLSTNGKWNHYKILLKNIRNNLS